MSLQLLLIVTVAGSLGLKLLLSLVARRRAHA
jgi:hypothetical protein